MSKVERMLLVRLLERSDSSISLRNRGGSGGRLVSFSVESDEEEQVRGQDDTSESGSAFSTGTTSHSGESVREVLSSEVRVSGKVNYEQVNHELCDLESRKVLLPPDLVSSSSHEVVVIHEDMNGKVGSNGYPRDRSSSVQLCVTKESSRGVMEYMEEL